MKKIWFDAEFSERDITLDTGVTHTLVELISLGMVDGDGNTFYAVSNAFNKRAAYSNIWLHDNVLAKLPPQEEWISLDDMRNKVVAYIGEEPVQMRYYFLEQDVVLLRYILSDRFLDSPDNIIEPYYNIAQRFNDLGAPKSIVPPNPNIHDALYDAIWTKAFDEAMDDFEETSPVI